MNIQKSTHSYEAWLAERITLVPADLAFKHTQMAAGAFPFLRATFYRLSIVFEEARLMSKGDDQPINRRQLRPPRPPSQAVRALEVPD